MKKRVLSLLLTMAMMVSLLPNAFAAKKATFTDVAEDMWCFDYVEFVAGKGYFKGTTATTFNPAGTMTRQQFVTVLARMAGVEVDNSKTAFSDVPAGSYSAGSVAWAAKEGIVTGYADGTFHPTAPVTRQQMCAFMSRFMDYYAEAKGVYFLKKGTVSGFADYAKIADYAVDAVDRCRTYGLILGYAEDNTFRPAASATRAHVAAVIYRLAQIIAMAGGGGGGPAYSYTLNFVDTNVAAGEEPKVLKTETASGDAATHVFQVEIANPIDELADGEDKVFVNWTDGTTTYTLKEITVDSQSKWVIEVPMEIAEGETSATKDLTTFWANANDLLLIAMGKAADDANTMAKTKIGKVTEKVGKYANGSASVALAEPATKTSDREVTMTVSAELKTITAEVDGQGFVTTAAVDKVAELALQYALELVSYTTLGQVKDLYTTTKQDCYDIVDEVLKAMGVDDWWTEGTYRAKLEALGTALYEDIKAQVTEPGQNGATAPGPKLWAHFKDNAEKAPLTTKATVMNGSTVLMKVDGQNLFEADGTTALSYKRAVARVAKAAGLKLYSSLQAKCQNDFVYDFVVNNEDPSKETAPSATLSVVFTMSDTAITIDAAGNKAPISTITKDFNTSVSPAVSAKYNVTAKLELTQTEDILGYRFTNNENQAKLVITDFMQAEYANLVDEVARKAMANPRAQQELTDRAFGIVKSMIPADLKGSMTQTDYDELYVAVTDWVYENCRTDVGADYSSEFYLPFVYLWDLEGEVGTDGKSVADDSKGIVGGRLLLNNGYLTDYVKNLAIKVVAKRFDPTGVIGLAGCTEIEDAVKMLINDKVNNLDLTAVQSAITNSGMNPADLDVFLQTDFSDHSAHPLNSFYENLQNTLRTEIDTALNARMNAFLGDPANAEVKKLVEAVGAQAYLKGKVMARVGLLNTYPIGDEDAVIAALTAEAQKGKVVNVDVITAAMIGQYEHYLNQIGLVKTVGGMENVGVNELATLLQKDAFHTVLTEIESKGGSYVPKLIDKLAKAIAKVETNPSKMLVDGEEISMAAISAIRTELKKANPSVVKLSKEVGKFLEAFGTLSIADFSEANGGVLVEAYAAAKGYEVDSSVRLFVEVVK